MKNQQTEHTAKFGLPQRNLNRRGTTLRLLAYKDQPYSVGIW